MASGKIRRLRAFGGGPLKGFDVVRLVYFDESGISNIKEEPHVVVVGVITEPDKNYLAIEAHLAKLALNWVPADRQDKFVAFHATELFNGGPNFPRPEWNIERTLPIIKRLLKTPWRFGLPIVYGICDRQRHLATRAERPKTVKKRTEAAYQQAFLLALIRTNAWMRKNARPEELAMVIVEDNDQMRTAIKSVLTFLQYPAQIGPEFLRHIPLEKIIESVIFAKKEDSSILQIADMCAYVIKRRIGNKPHSEDLFGTIASLIHWAPTSENDPVRAAAAQLRNKSAGFRTQTRRS